MAKELHLGFHDACQEYRISEEKINRHLEEQKKTTRRKEYGKSDLMPKVYRIRQENERIK